MVRRGGGDIAVLGVGIGSIACHVKRIVTVTTVVRATFVYKPESNHDPDGDSNGTVVIIARK